MLPIIINNPFYKLIEFFAQPEHYFLIIILSLSAGILTLGIQFVVLKFIFKKFDIKNAVINSVFIGILLFAIIHFLGIKPFLNGTLPLKIQHYEGLYFFTAIVCALIHFVIIAKQNNLNLEILSEGIFIGIIAALITGRLFSLIFWNGSEFIKNPLMIFRIWEGGISITGGVVGGLTAGFIYAKFKKLHFLYHISIMIPSLLIGQIVGRFGCFLNGDCAGIASSLPWALVYDKSSVAYFPYTDIAPGTKLHPTQLYEISGNIILLTFLILTGNNKWIKNRRFIWYIIGYSTIRFFCEFFRSDHNLTLLKILSTGQLICIAGFITGTALLIWSILNNNKLDPDDTNNKIAFAKSNEETENAES